MVHNEFVLSEKGASRMDFHHQWEYEEAPKRGLRNPWNHRPDKPTYQRETIYLDPNNKKHGIQMTRSIYPKVSEEEMTAWKIERNECETYSLSEQFRKSIFPCESQSEAQCNLYCPIYKDCALRLCDGEVQKGDE